MASVTTPSGLELRPLLRGKDYWASADGEIWSTKRMRGMGMWKMKQSLNSNGYPTTRLEIDGEPKRLTIHGLVAGAFFGALPYGMLVRHLNGDRTDNRLENLSWGTPKDNTDDRENHGRTAKGTSHGKAILSEAEVRSIRQLLEQNVELPAIALQFGISAYTVQDIKIGRTWKSVI